MAAGLLKNFTESFFSKIGEKLTDYGLEKVTRKDSKFMLETLQRSLNSLSDKACDISEQIRHGELSGKKKRKREVENWLKEVKKMESELDVLQHEVQEEKFLGWFFGEDRVSELNARVCELVEQCRHFGEVLFVAHEMRGEPLLTARLIGEEFMENIEVILELLLINEVKSIGICGMGGVGKTALAKHINSRLLKETQCSVCWVSVSQVFTINKLQNDMAKFIGLDLSDEDDEDKRAGRLNQALSLKKDFVLILDDVWTDIDLEKLGDPLGVEGCKLIVTTRSLTVCQRIDCQEIIKVETLQTDESWTLFRETLGKITTITSEVEEIAKCVAKQCDGLPLGIIVLAKSMKGVTDIREWRNVYNEICVSPMELDGMKGNVFRVLEYSFNRLDSDFHEKRRRRNGYTKLQLCFLYCSLYPEDHEINIDELIRKFISEELVDTRKSREKQLDQGYSMLSKLLNLCLLEPIYNLEYDETFEFVRMHDLVRDMALEIVRGSPKYKVFGGLGLKKIPNEEEWTEDVDKMSLMWNDIVEIPEGMAPNCPKLATLLLNENPLKSIPESFFTQMISSLHILDLSETRIQELPNSLFDLESLNTLLLENCMYLVSLPFLGKLKALRELDLSGTSIERIPKGMENLINLKILLFRGTKSLKLQPGDLSLVSPYLQHLELPFEIEAPVHEIVKFKQLKIFVGSFKDFSDFDWFQCQTGGLISNFHYKVGSVDDYHSKDDTFMNINTLSMYNCSLMREGEDGVIILPESTLGLQIENCKGLSSCLLGDLKSRPRFLEKLRIDHCEGIKSIWNINDQFMAEPPISIGSIDLIGLPDLKGLVNWEVGGAPPPSPPPQAAMVFSSIQRLSICGCDSMKTLGAPLTLLENIEFIDIVFCDELEELIQLVEQVADDDEGISQLTVPLPNLKELCVGHLPKLKSICKARIDCVSIEVISIVRCPRVKKLPLFLPSPLDDGQVINYSPLPALRKIVIEEEIWESLEWDDPTHKHLLQPFVIYHHHHTN